MLLAVVTDPLVNVALPFNAVQHLTGYVGDAAPPCTGCASPGPLGAVGGVGDADGNTYLLTFTLSNPATVQFAVEDFVLTGDFYDLILNGTEIMETSHVPAGGSSFSQGTVTENLGAGSYSVAIWDVLLSYIGFSSPFGGTVTQFYSPASVTLEADLLSSVPEPATVLLACLGLLGIAVNRSIRRATNVSARTHLRVR